MASGTCARWLTSEKPLIAVCILAGMVCAWAGRYSMNPDGISYLDLGDALVQHNWQDATNAYWSPLYPLLLGLVLHLVRPSLWWQFPLVHLVNLFIFVWSLFCFRYFMNGLLGGAERNSGLPERVQPLHLPGWFLRPAGYAVFLWCSLDLIGIQIVTPDLLLSSWIFLLVALLLRLREGGSHAMFLLFGVLLGAAYLSKSFMFPMAFVFLVVLFLSGRSSSARAGNVLLAAAAFFAISLPPIAALSEAKGRPTFSDAGRLTYAWLVSPQVPIVNAQPEQAAELLHPTRKLMAHPAVYEFARPVAGTYPPWYDPSYWNDGIKPRFHLRAQLQTVAKGMGVYWRLLLSQWGWLAGSLALLVLGGPVAAKGIVGHWPPLIVCSAALVTYSLVLVVPRYPAPFLAVACFSVLAGVGLPLRAGPRRIAKFVALATLGAILLSVAQPLITKGYQKWSGERPEGSREEPIRVAANLSQMGLSPRESIAIIGDGTSDYWARLANLRIVAQIMPGDEGSNEFWRLPAEDKASVYEAIANTGARALITRDPSRADLGAGWLRIKDTSYHVHFLGSLVSATAALDK